MILLIVHVYYLYKDLTYAITVIIITHKRTSAGVMASSSHKQLSTRNKRLYSHFPPKRLLYLGGFYCHRVVCSSSMYGFRLPLWYLQTLPLHQQSQPYRPTTLPPPQQHRKQNKANKQYQKQDEAKDTQKHQFCMYLVFQKIVYFYSVKCNFIL